MQIRTFRFSGITQPEKRVIWTGVKANNIKKKLVFFKYFIYSVIPLLPVNYIFKYIYLNVMQRNKEILNY